MVNILKFLFGILLFNFQIVDVFSKDNIFHEKKNLISHAGVFIDNHAYTNSIEALQNSISKGFYMIELDLRLTSDNVFVALHSWKDIEKIFSPKTNRFFSPGKAIRWVLFENNIPIGRVAAFINKKTSNTLKKSM